MKLWPALDVGGSELALAAVDDFAPVAVEERETGARVFFTTAADRDAARAALAAALFPADPIDVADEDWARRSQDGLTPVTVGRITVAPPWNIPVAPSPEPSALLIVILPSMGFGTGHHATTRLCLAALQAIDLSGRSVLDVGTGSGVLAIAAARLGAATALGIDNDPDAIESAKENLALNPGAGSVTFHLQDLAAAPLPPADVVTANLTGALLAREAVAISRAVRPGGTVILSGLLDEERAAVLAAFTAAELVSAAEETGWVRLTLRRR